MLRIEVESFRRQGFPEDVWNNFLVKLPDTVARELYQGGEVHYEVSLAEVRIHMEMSRFDQSVYTLVVTVWTGERHRGHYVDDDLATVIAKRVKEYFLGEPFQDVTVGVNVLLVPAARGSA